MNKTDKIKKQIKILQKELKQLEANLCKAKIYWTDTTYGYKHTTTVEAKTAAAAKRIFKNKKLNYVKWGQDHNCGPNREIVGYVIDKITIK